MRRYTLLCEREGCVSEVELPDGATPDWLPEGWITVRAEYWDGAAEFCSWDCVAQAAAAFRDAPPLRLPDAVAQAWTDAVNQANRRVRGG